MQLLRHMAILILWIIKLLLVRGERVIGNNNGVWLTVMGANVENDGYVALDLIGDSDRALLCHTNKSDCCNRSLSVPSGPRGNWYFPNGTQVRYYGSQNMANHSFFARNRDQSIVRLYRFNHEVTPTPNERGQFYCRIPDHNNVTQILYVNILDIGAVSITPSQVSGIAGKMQASLECSVQIVVAENVTYPTFQWLYSQDNSSLLSGMYTCRLGGNERMAATATVAVNVTFSTSISVMGNSIHPSNDVWPVGSNLTMSCVVAIDLEMTSEEVNQRPFDRLISAMIYINGASQGRLILTGPTVTGTAFTYTTQLNSFERSDSGNYTCNATFRSQTPSLYFIESGSSPNTVRVTTGVYMSLGGTIYRNNSNISITDIGEGEKALLCYTDLTTCCKAGARVLGQWYFPNRSSVETGKRTYNDVYRNRGDSVVRLNRRNNATHPLGNFCCVVPDATSTNVTVCANIILDSSTTPTMDRVQEHEYTMTTRLEDIETLHASSTPGTSANISDQVLNENVSNDVAIIGGAAGTFSLLLVIVIAIPIIIGLLRCGRVGNGNKVFSPSHPVTFSKICKHKEIVETMETIQDAGTMEMDANQAYMTHREAQQQQDVGTMEYLEMDTNQAYITNSVPTEPNMAYGTHPPEVHHYEHVTLPSET